MTTRRARRIVAVTLCAVSAAVLPASAAMANWEGCGFTGQSCNYKNTDGASGGVHVYLGFDRDYSDDAFQSCTLNCGVNDATSSIWNRESYTNRYYTAADFGNAAFDVGPGVKKFAMPNYNDQLSSHKAP